jgi:hypothetical protein
VNSNSTPEFDGECAFALSTGKSGVPGSSKHSLVDGDKTYHFSNGVARLLWKVLPNRADKASAAWSG